MRTFAPIVAFLTAMIIAAWALAPPRNPYVPSVAPRELLMDRDYWHGRRVKVPTDGMVTGPNDALVYKKFADRDPVLVVTWAGTPPVNRPSLIIGTFHAGTPCYVRDCRPAP